MPRIILLLSALSLVAILLACSDPEPVRNDSPTEAYKRLYSAVKSKDSEAIKQQVSKKTHELAEMSSQRFNKPIEKAYENGFTATTFSETPPPIRDERVKDDMGAVEVWNSKDRKWEDLPFIYEDGAWKLAIGDAFSGSFRSPGKGRDFYEREAANALSNTVIQLPAGNNANMPANTVPAPGKSPASK